MEGGEKKGKGGSDGREGVSLRERAIGPKTTDPVTHHCFISARTLCAQILTEPPPAGQSVVSLRWRRPGRSGPAGQAMSGIATGIMCQFGRVGPNPTAARRLGGMGGG